MDRSPMSSATSTNGAVSPPRLTTDTNAVDSTSSSHEDDAGVTTESHPPLELGWTRLGKRPVSDSRDSTSLPSKSRLTMHASKSEEKQRSPPDGAEDVWADQQGSKNHDNNDEDEDDFWSWQGSSPTCWSCTDPSCVARRQGGGEASGGGGEEGISFLRRRRVGDSRGGSGGDSQQVSERLRVVRGNAAWLLPTASTTDVDWFQGYLMSPPPAAPTSGDAARKPWGLLAQQVDIDECLACADGGYRRVSITLYDWSGPPRSDGPSSSKNLGEADWTGGDMMKLLGSNVRMRPAKLLTGEAAVPYVTGLFRSLWKRIVTDHERESCELDGTGNKVLDLLPDVAIVLGDMELIVPVDP